MKFIQKRLNRKGAKNAKKIVGTNPCVRPKRFKVGHKDLKHLHGFTGERL